MTILVRWQAVSRAGPGWCSLVPVWSAVKDSTYSRRRLLGTATALAAGATVVGGLGGCGLLDRDKPDPPDSLDPLLAATVALAARYDAAIANQPQLAERLTSLRDAHRAHAKALAQLIGRPASSLSPSPPATTTAPTPADAAAAVAELRKAERSGQEAAADACLAAHPDRTALLGSIAAARASHLEVLDD